jgi:hypothetical protein
MKLKRFCGFKRDAQQTFVPSAYVCSLDRSQLKKSFISTYTQFGEKDKLHT